VLWSVGEYIVGYQLQQQFSEFLREQSFIFRSTLWPVNLLKMV
jgi:hypothetical protein